MKAYQLTRQARYKARNPWVRFVEWARARCNLRPGHKDFPYYAGKGITCDLTSAECRGIWERDNAENMVRPSLDRKDPSGNYTKANVRFIEYSLNAAAAWNPALLAAMDDSDAEFS